MLTCENDCSAIQIKIRLVHLIVSSKSGTVLCVSNVEETFQCKIKTKWKHGRTVIENRSKSEC